MLNQISKLLGHYETGQLNRRDLILGLAALAAAPRASAQSSSPFKGLELNHIALHVSDVQRSRDFYRELLNAPVLFESENPEEEFCFLGLGDFALIALFGPSVFPEASPGLYHYAIGIEDYDVDRVTDELTRRGLNPRRHEGTDRVYFDDPDGIGVQLIAQGKQDI